MTRWNCCHSPLLPLETDFLQVAYRLSPQLEEKKTLLQKEETMYAYRVFWTISETSRCPINYVWVQKKWIKLFSNLIIILLILQSHLHPCGWKGFENVFLSCLQSNFTGRMSCVLGILNPMLGTATVDRILIFWACQLVLGQVALHQSI